jgi:predicted metal-binding membrane protein
MNAAVCTSTASRSINAARVRQVASLGGWTLLFVVCATATILLCARMSQMTGMPMPGGWTMSMMWMRMPGQSWLGVLASFLGMWIVMMMAMMLPSLIPVIAPYRSRAIAMATAYFVIWAAAGAAAACIGFIVGTLSMQLPQFAQAAPLLSSAVVVVTGFAQFSSWRTQHLVCCRAPAAYETMLTSTHSPWRAGVRLGVHCVGCCANLTLLLLVLGMMDLRAMTAVTIAVTLERRAPIRWRTHKIIGIALVASGLSTICGCLGSIE